MNSLFPSHVPSSSPHTYQLPTLAPLALIYQEKMDVKGKTETKAFPFTIPSINAECLDLILSNLSTL
jgi:hypothetical protein